MIPTPDDWRRIYAELAATKRSMSSADSTQSDFLVGKFAALLLVIYPRLTASTAIHWAQETWDNRQKS